MNQHLGAAWLAVRSLIWTGLLPGVQAGYLPWRFFGLREAHPQLGNPVDLLGLALMFAGTALLAACIVEFARSGHGTLSPADPPKELVVQGLYRFVRNPMYLGVITILIGECLVTRSWSMLEFTGAWIVVVNLFIVGYEEPTLRREFGAPYERYVREVGRWMPSLRPANPDRTGRRGPV